MKKIFVGILAIGMLGFAFTTSSDVKVELKTENNESAEGVHFFKGTWDEALTKAKKENKLIFLDAYTSWCGWCKKLDANTLSDKAVGDYFNENFINVHMDMEKSTEGPRLARKLGIRGYPALFFVNSTEEVKHFVSGYVVPEKIIVEGKKAVKLK
jgi:thioredoxin 1